MGHQGTTSNHDPFVLKKGKGKGKKVEKEFSVLLSTMFKVSSIPNHQG